MTNYYYPAIFHIAEEGGFWITFPDFPECMTQGEDIADAYKMATEALGLCIDERIKQKEPLPSCTVPSDLIVKEGSFSCVIEFNLDQYRRKNCSRAVKKTLSIPEWLNEACIEQGINFSQVLQEALISKLGL